MSAVMAILSQTVSGKTDGVPIAPNERLVLREGDDVADHVP